MLNLNFLFTDNNPFSFSEFLYDDKKIFEYNCDRKEEFIKKGVTKSRTSAKDKSSWFHKFPKDIVQCEEMTGGDPQLLEKPPYMEEKNEKVDYKEIFGTPDADKKGKAASPKKGAQGTTSITVCLQYLLSGSPLH